MSKPLLILDIDETLVHGRVEPLERAADFSADFYHIYMRPHVHEFLKIVSAEYNLACWSSATQDYLETILKEFSRDLEPLQFVWDRRRCTRRFDFILQEEFFLKDLRKVKRAGFDLNRVLILEDEPRKVNRNYGNAIYVKPYFGAIDDEELPKLARYLIEISQTENFRTLEKRSWRAKYQ